MKWVEMSHDSVQQGDEVAFEALPPFLAYSRDEMGAETALFDNGLEHLLRRPPRFAWDDLCELYRRIETHAQGHSTLEELFAERALQTPSFGRLMKMAGLVTSPTLLYTLGNRFTMARIFAHLLVQSRTLDDGRVVIDITIPDSHQDCPQMFKGTAGILTALPQLLGLGRAHVQAKYSLRKARYEVTPPPSMTVAHRLKRAFKAFALGRQALGELTDQQAQLNTQLAELHVAYAKTQEALLVRRRFLSVISHELRTPLNGIVGAASALNEETEPAARDRMSESLQTSIVQMSNLVETILEFTRLDDGQSRPITAAFNPKEDLQPILQKSKSEANDKRLDYSVHFTPQVPGRITIDGQRVVQIASQLLSNGVKFTDSGHVHVQIDYVPDRGLIIEVRDSGPGMSAEDIPKAFEMFSQLDSSSTRAHGGIGLGLTLSRQLAEVLGGRIDLESVVGEGTTARVTLPCEVLEHVTPRRVLDPAERTGQVLVVDDDKTNRLIMTHMLKKRGWRSEVARDGVEACEKALAHNFDMIFMDCEMPRMNGFEATTNIRQNSPHSVPIVATTAYVTDSDRERCFEVGMDDFLGKPVQAKDLDRVLEEWFSDS